MVRASITNFGAEFWGQFRPTLPALDHMRDIVVSGVERIAKPDPAIFAHALAPLGTLPERALHIGDTRTQDIAGARAAGWQSAWVNRSGAPPDDEHHPDVEIATLEDLLDLLGLR